MEQMEPMDDTEIQEKVESLVGKGTRVIDCEKSTSFQTQEVLLVNGFPVPLNGEEGARIKKALMEGQVPPGDLLNEILIRAGILKAPVELETTMNVKSTTKTTELLTLRDKHGILVDERMKEVEEDNEVNSMSTEVWKKEDKKNEEELRQLGKRVERINLKTKHQHNQQHQRQYQHGGPPSSPPPPPPSHPPPDDDDDDQQQQQPSSSAGPGGDSTMSGLNRNHSSSSSSSSSSSFLPSHHPTNHLNNNNNNVESTLTKKPTLESSSFVTPFAKFVHGCLSSPPPPSSGAGATETGQSSSSPAIIQDNNNALPPTSISAVNGSSSTCSLANGTSILCSAAAAVVATATAAAAPTTATVSPEGNPYPSNSHCSQQQQQQQQQYSHRGGPNVASASASANDWDHALVYQNTNVGTLAAGTLEALIEHLIPTETYYPEKSYVFAFVLSSRLFLPPHQLLGHVFHQVISTPTHSPKYKPTRESNVPHMVKLLGEWTELFPYDFRDEQMMAHVRNITQKCVTINPPIRTEVSLLLTSLLARLTALEKYEDFLHRINTEAALGDPLTYPSLVTICPSPSILAQQLTHIELERLSYIGPEEFVQAFAKDSSQVDPNYKEIKKTRNLECYVQWFNRLSYLVATEICKVPKKKNRVRQVEFWIECARESFNIGNFNSLMAIIAGLNMAPVARLKKTWSKVCSLSQLAVLESQMEPSANFSSYRSTLKAAVWRSVGATDERQRMVIPFFSLLVKDLYFLNEGCASKLPNGYVNFEKIWNFARQVTEVIQWQQVPCTFPKVQTVLDSLNAAPIFTENALSLASYECESANSQEKERFKYLRKEEASSSEVSDSSPKKKHFKKTKKVLNSTTAVVAVAGPSGASSSSSSAVTASTSSPQQLQLQLLQQQQQQEADQGGEDSQQTQDDDQAFLQLLQQPTLMMQQLFNDSSGSSIILENPELENFHQLDLSPA